MAGTCAGSHEGCRPLQNSGRLGNGLTKSPVLLFYGSSTLTDLLSEQT
jgi:hypothetical protein